eukprot:3270859-Rhodomonas_salina.3
MNLTTAEAPHGGDFRVSKTNGTALIDEWAVSCNLWTPHDVDLLPLRYTFKVDVGDSAGELRIRDTAFSHELSGFVLPSSRKTIPDPRRPLPATSEGWILCRRSCPVTLAAEIVDQSGATARVVKEVSLHRWSCLEGDEQYAPCNRQQMLVQIEGLLRSIDVQAADLQDINFRLLIIALELSDLGRFDLSAEDGAEPPETENPLFSGQVLVPTQVGTGTSSPTVTRRRARAAVATARNRDEAAEAPLFDFDELEQAISEDIAEALALNAEEVDVVQTRASSTPTPAQEEPPEART